jgi:nitrate reductase delta subunit
MKNEMTQTVLAVASSLLQYPDEQMRSTLSHLERAIANITLKKIKQNLTQFIKLLRESDPLVWNEQYVKTFDFNRKTNLYLTYFQQGEQRERGFVLLQLKQQYEQAGFSVTDCELPDYLPLLLEFAAVTVTPGIKLIDSYMPQIQTIYEELKQEHNPYHLVFEAFISAIHLYKQNEQEPQAVGGAR